MTEWYSWWFLTGKADDWVVFLVIFNGKSWWLSGIPTGKADDWVVFQQEKLMTEWYFLCGCPRCSSPDEFQSNFSSPQVISGFCSRFVALLIFYKFYQNNLYSLFSHSRLGPLIINLNSAETILNTFLTELTFWQFLTVRTDLPAIDNSGG